jgi:hypothetical protein
MTSNDELDAALKGYKPGVDRAAFWLTIGQVNMLADAYLQSRQQAEVGELQVWYGAMPESNGRTNWTAILHRGDLVEGYTLARSEYPDRVRYDADCVHSIISGGERPDILQYDGDACSGWTTDTPK